MTIERVPFLPEVWMVPATLADLECRHGRIGACRECDAARALSKEAEEMPEPRWTRDEVVRAIREVAEQNGGVAPTGQQMRDAGYGGAYQVATFERLETTWAELVTEAGYEPRVRGSHGNGGGTDLVREDADPVRKEDMSARYAAAKTGDELAALDEELRQAATKPPVVEGPGPDDPEAVDFESIAELVARVLVAREKLAVAEHEFWAAIDGARAVG